MAASRDGPEVVLFTVLAGARSLRRRAFVSRLWIVLQLLLTTSADRHDVFARVARKALSSLGRRHMGRLGRSGARLTEAISLVVELDRIAQKRVVHSRVEGEFATDELDFLNVVGVDIQLRGSQSVPPAESGEYIPEAEPIEAEKTSVAAFVAVQRIHAGKDTHEGKIRLGGPAGRWVVAIRRRRMMVVVMVMSLAASVGVSRRSRRRSRRRCFLG